MSWLPVVGLALWLGWTINWIVVEEYRRRQRVRRELIVGLSRLAAALHRGELLNSEEVRLLVWVLDLTDRSPHKA